ncbi:MICAL-like protein 2a [Cololabis saira]|uniref:MICAL-like protein 2a n=1 Tax=Cololabis saira TaxID=129043 RepID=UPI002AD345ED|nr:MICAL-like protein 2a [Cololabis saira]
MAAIKALELWCRGQCEGYRDVAITNMTSSFRSGLAFCALIHRCRPDLIDYDSLRKEDVFENNKLAFQIAEEELGIPALLDAEDMVALRVPDRLSILTYVSQYYNYFKGRPPMGGVKRPAEGSKEEPSEKKNLPVVAKTFVSKTATEKRSAPTLPTQHSPRLARAAAQEVGLINNGNKSGTLTSKCVACNSHVHLVQRHFVEGKLYHRSCFKCCECASVLHVGGYKPGRNPDTFVCKTHPSGSDTPSADAGVRNGLATPAVRSKSAQLAPRPSSVLSSPIKAALKPASPPPPSRAWTASAQKTQEARQKFFQVTQQTTETPTGTRKHLEPLERPKVLLSPDRGRGRLTGEKPAEKNSNNNNKRPFTIRSAGTRFCDEPSPVGSSGLRVDKCSQVAAGSSAAQPTSSHINKRKPPCLKTINKDDPRPTVVHNTAKDPIYREWQMKGEPVKTEQRPKPRPLRVSIPVLVDWLRVHPLALSPILTSPKGEITCFLKGIKGGRFKRGSCSPTKSPPRLTTDQSAGSLTVKPVNPSAAKKGKYLSPTAAFRTEMRSPSVKSHHIPAEQIEKELRDIETNLAQLEKEGVELEKMLRSCEEEGEGDVLMDPLMVDWFNLIQKKQIYIRKESELVYIARTQELEQQQPGVEGELRRLLDKPDHLKSRDERQREKKLLQRLMDIVDGRNAIVEGLDEDRLREVEEDQQLNKMMQNLGVKKGKNKRKSSISKLFRRRSKRRVE